MRELGICSLLYLVSAAYSVAFLKAPSV